MAHTKRIAAGLGKAHVWAVTPAPGHHSKGKCISLLALVRDKLKYADTSREAMKIINDGMILVGRSPRKNYKYNIGIMDVIRIPKAGKNFRCMPDKKGLSFKEIPDEEAKFKLCKILDKSVISGGKIQLNLHDGTNIIVPEDPEKKYETRDTILIDIETTKITDLIEFNIGNIGLVVSGRHTGKVGKIDEIVKATAARKSLTVIDGMPTLTDYVLVIGKDKPVISI